MVGVVTTIVIRSSSQFKLELVFGQNGQLGAISNDLASGIGIFG